MGCERGLVAVNQPKEETVKARGISRSRQRNPILVLWVANRMIYELVEYHTYCSEYCKVDKYLL